MKLKGLFGILTFMLIAIIATVSYVAIRFNSSIYILAAVELLTVLTAIYLIVFYRRIIKPLEIIGNGMDLLREQDFSSRLKLVGQPEADKIVKIFNRMMEEMKNERLRVREKNHFLDLLINVSPMGVIILDLDEKVMSLNPSATKILGVRDIMGLSFEMIDIPLVQGLHKIARNSSSTVRLSDASIYKCTHSSFADRGFYHSFYLIESLTEEMFKAEMKAYEKVIRMIAHEVNNTTAGITSTLDTLFAALGEMENTDDIAQALQIAIERCYSMNRFITNFADVVRIPEPQPRKEDLNRIVESSQLFMSTVCLNRNINIVMELSDVSPVASIDSALFEQVLVNIIKNSAESIDDSGSIYIRTSIDPACLEISDTGRGIDRDDEAKLFTPFFSTKPQGQGLGLIFIREVLQKHDCTFSLRTYPDGLTRFRICFPRR